MIPVEWALEFERLGIAEIPGNNDGPPSILFMRGEKLAWCAGFVLTCIQLGLELSDGDVDYWHNRNVGAFEAWTQRQRKWFQAGESPCRGDVVFFGDRGLSDTGPGRHCGFVTGVGLDGDILTVEGNVSNGIQSRRYSPTDRRITGYARFGR